MSETDVILPDSRYGMTLTRFHPKELPHSLPQRDAMLAANAYNHARYYTLTAKQRVFVDAYLESAFDHVVAAISAGYPREEANKVGKKLLRNKHVHAAVQYALEYNRQRGLLRTDQVVAELQKIAFASPREFLGKDDRGRPEIVMPDKENEIFDSVQEITVTTSFTKDGDENRTTKVKMYDKQQALNTLLKYLEPAVMSNRGPAVVNNNTATATATASVSVINLLPVPVGQFLPPPEVPDMKLIEHSPLLEINRPGLAPTAPVSVLEASRASVPDMEAR